MGIAQKFRSETRERAERESARRKWFIKGRQDHNRQARQEQLDNADAAALSAAGSILLATELQIREFERKLELQFQRLDVYDAKLTAYEQAVVQALEENAARLLGLKEELVDVERDIEMMLDHADVLPDDRRVFKSRDGLIVEDEFGANVRADEVDFDLISSGLALEDFKALTVRHNEIAKELTATVGERNDLIQTLDEIGNARVLSAERRTALESYRAKSDNGELGVGDIEEAELEFEDFDTMGLPVLPLSAAKFLSSEHAPVNTQGASTQFQKTAKNTVVDMATVSRTPSIQPETP